MAVNPQRNSAGQTRFMKATGKSNTAILSLPARAVLRFRPDDAAEQDS
jgi:hypothetical protein